jgi:CDP-diacylglycerol--serine O-phosphatidyltransferase
MAARRAKAKGSAKAAPVRARPRSTANALTLACLGLAFLAALAAGRGDKHAALSLLALAGLADTLAGRVAHGWELQSEIGAELDSLASLMVWGVATMLLAYSAGLAQLGPWGTALTGLGAISAAWRLCKGDLQQGRSLHEGLPLPAAGALTVAAVAFQAPPVALAYLVLAAAIAQLLPVRYPRPAVPLLLAMPLLLSLGAAAFNWPWGWALPGAAALIWGFAGPFFHRWRSA